MRKRFNRHQCRSRLHPATNSCTLNNDDNDNEYTGNFYGGQTRSDGFNLKNGAEFYSGITEMLQAMDTTVDPCRDFCEYHRDATS